MEEMQKVYCMPQQHDNSQLLAELINAKNGDGTAMAWNNPFIYLVWLAMFRNGGFGGSDSGQGQQNVEMMGKLNDIGAQMQSNQNTNLMMDAISGNHEALHQLSASLGVNTATLQGAICNVQSAITQVGGQVGYSAERVINSVLLGNKDLTAAVQNCCCNTQQNIIKSGYENQLAIQGQTQALSQLLERNNSNVERGFSTVAFENAQGQQNIINAGNANTQRIIDTLNCHWSAELQQKLQDARFELSQERQNAYLVSQLKTTQS